MRQDQIKNFVIISHIDHGKSTLADRFLELTKTVSQAKMRPQFLDMMDLEREKGITIKMQPVRMSYSLDSQSYILNLIDTPGHVDFSYEVSRSLAAVEGAVLLVDATRGIQAQTLANLELAKKQNLVIIPAVNKIDVPYARVEETAKELSCLLGINENEVIKISAKYGTNVEKVLEAIIKKIPVPKTELQKPFQALIFDSKYDPYKGVIAYVRILEGQIRQGENIYLIRTQAKGEAKEVGYFRPELSPESAISAGEIGYIATGIKESGKVRVGETIAKIPNVNPLPGYKEPKPMVFASIYLENPDDFDLLKEALAKLKLNDASLTFKSEMKDYDPASSLPSVARPSVARGYLCGFLGSLHAEIVSERLRREFGLSLIISMPSVVYKIFDKNDNDILVHSARDWPDPSRIEKIQEPWVKLEVMTPSNYLGRVLELLEKLEGNHIETKYFGADKTLLIYETPLREIISRFYDNLKGVTQGYASMNYEILGFREADLVKMDILIAGKEQKPLSKIVPKARAYQEGNKLVKKLKEILPPQLFSVPLQATVSGKVIARETIKAKRRDVLAPLYGGDYTRKRKLLEKQKKGKKKLKERGEVNIPPNVFLEIFRS